MTENAKWFFDHITPDLIHLHAISDVLYRGKSAFQEMEVVDTPGHGHCLILDGKIQSSERDEFIYHESLVQPAMVAHPRPEKVFIAGGGEGATLREVLRHPTVKRVVMVDIDKAVIDVSKKFMPSMSAGTFDDKRLELLHEDARGYLVNSKEKFDVAIIDIPDPLEGGPAYLLFTEEFYGILRKRLSKDGIIVVQSGPAYLGNLDCYTAIARTMSTSFPVVSVYNALVPSFGGAWGFTTGSANLDPSKLSADEIDGTLKKRKVKGLRFYDGLTHQGMFSVPKYLRTAIAEEKRVITDKKPFFAY